MLQPQVFTTAAWAGMCLLLVLQSCRHLKPEQAQLLWTFFQPAGPMLLMLLLYAQAIRYFEQQHVSQDECYAEADRRFLASSKELFALARALVCFAAACLASSTALCATGGSRATAAALLVPPLMYSAAAVLMVAPVSVLKRAPRMFFCRTLGRVLLPTQAVSWADFLLADMMTSLAKSSSDLSRAACLILHGELINRLTVADFQALHAMLCSSKHKQWLDQPRHMVGSSHPPVHSSSNSNSMEHQVQQQALRSSIHGVTVYVLPLCWCCLCVCAAQASWHTQCGQSQQQQQPPVAP
jgi:hypothetical protein